MNFFKTLYIVPGVLCVELHTVKQYLCILFPLHSCNFITFEIPSDAVNLLIKLYDSYVGEAISWQNEF